MAVMLSLLSVSLLNFGNSAARISGVLLPASPWFSPRAGCVMIPVSITFAVYALRIFLSRNNAIANRDEIRSTFFLPQTKFGSRLFFCRYDDVRGPVVLVIVLVTALILSTVFAFTIQSPTRLQTSRTYPL